jgi:CTP synthase
LGDIVLDVLGLEQQQGNLIHWKGLIDSIATLTETITIAVIGKYVNSESYVNTDTYISVVESIKHAARHCGKKPLVKRINSSDYEEHPELVHELTHVDAVVIPGGFGTRGIE